MQRHPPVRVSISSNISFRDRCTRVIAPFANALASVLVAPPCAVCGELLDTPLGGCVCGRCWNGIHTLGPALAPPRGIITAVAAVGEYEGSLRDILHAFKYQGRLSLAGPLAARMRRYGGSILDDANCVVPVPLHWRRRQSRGFNQAYELARRLGPPVVHALRRTRHTQPQVTLAADRRHANVRGAFALRRSWLHAPVSLTGRTVVLVDDVSTTGATLEACATVLWMVGAREVRAMTAARVSPR